MENSNYGVSKQIEEAKAKLDKLCRIHMFRMWTDNERKEYGKNITIVMRL